MGANADRLGPRSMGLELALDPGDGSAPVRIGGDIGRIDRRPLGRIEGIDYKSGRASSRKDVADKLQLSIYALACRDATFLWRKRRMSSMLILVAAPRMFGSCCRREM